MNRRRLRKFVLIIGTTLCLLIAAVFMASAWFHATLRLPGSCAISVSSGGVAVWINALLINNMSREEPSLALWNEWHTDTVWGSPINIDFNTKLQIIWIPLWPLFLAIALPTLLVWRLVPRFPRGHCRHCGYNLKGLTEPRCPECGARFEELTA